MGRFNYKQKNINVGKNVKNITARTKNVSSTIKKDISGIREKLYATPVNRKRTKSKPLYERKTLTKHH